MLQKTSARLNRWIEYLLFGIGLAMTLSVVAQVFCRYVLNQSLFWSEELGRFLLVWLTFLGASCAYHRQANPGVDLLVARMPHRLQRLSAVLTHLAAITLFSVMVIYGCRFAYFVRLQISPALQLPKWIVLSIIPASGAVLLLHAVNFLLSELKGGAHDR